MSENKAPYSATDAPEGQPAASLTVSELTKLLSTVLVQSGVTVSTALEACAAIIVGNLNLSDANEETFTVRKVTVDGQSIGDWEVFVRRMEPQPALNITPEVGEAANRTWMRRELLLSRIVNVNFYKNYGTPVNENVLFEHRGCLVIPVHYPTAGRSSGWGAFILDREDQLQETDLTCLVNAEAAIASARNKIDHIYGDPRLEKGQPA